jgi:hypothetical protein
LAGSCVAEDDEEPLGEALLPDAPPLAEPVLESLELGVDDEELAPALGALGELAPALGEAAPPLELGELALGGVELAPPDAEPELDFDASLEPDPLMPDEELEEDPGDVGDEEAPLDGDEGELGEAVLELEEPGVEEVLFESLPRSHAASPKARATAAARIESFMCPPWVGE